MLLFGKMGFAYNVVLFWLLVQVFFVMELTGILKSGKWIDWSRNWVLLEAVAPAWFCLWCPRDQISEVMEMWDAKYWVSAVRWISLSNLAAHLRMWWINHQRDFNSDEIWLHWRNPSVPVRCQRRIPLTQQYLYQNLRRLWVSAKELCIKGQRSLHLLLDVELDDSMRCFLKVISHTD